MVPKHKISRIKSWHKFSTGHTAEFSTWFTAWTWFTPRLGLLLGFAIGSGPFKGDLDGLALGILLGFVLG